MIKSNMSKKLLISLLMIFAVLFIKASYSHAATKYFNDFNELESSSEFYCIQYGIPITEGTWVSGSTEVVASDSGWESDRILAYILADAERTGDTGYNNNGDHQEAVWHWYTPSSIGANDVYNDAAAAAKTTINSTNSAELETGNLTVIEDIASLPIEEITGKINKIEVQFKDPVSKQTYTQTITTGNSGVNGWIEVYSDESCKNSINIENIKAGNVYFKILKENYEIVDIKCNVKADEAGYKVTITNWQKDTEASTEQDLITADVDFGDKEKDVTIKAVYPTGKLRITKVDKHFNEVLLNGAQFKIYSKTGWVVKLSDGTFAYNGTESEATEFTTKDKGQIEAELRYGKYEIYETKAPVGYDITKQDGYMNNNGKDPYSFSQNNKWVYTGRADIYANTLDNNVLKYTVTNKKVVDKIRGRVWVDNRDTKEYDYNNILDENGKDELVSGLKVTLYDKDHNEIAVTTTDANGYYEFTSKNSPNYTGEDKNLYYWELAGAYVEFTYDNKTYIVVNPFVGNDLKVNSKAIEYQMTVDELIDDDLTGTEGNLPGKATTYRNTVLATAEQILANNDDSNKDLKTTPLTGYYNNETYTIDDINLGIKEKVDPSYSVNEKLEYIKVTMKGYTYTYKYGAPAVTDSKFVPKVNKEIARHTYTSSLYPTDIAYNLTGNPEERDKMKVYVVYSITVTNNENTKVDDRYVEQRLYLDSLINDYDASRYDLCTTENNSDSSDFALWSGNNGTASYDLNNANSVYKDGIGIEDPKTSFIQFRMKDKTLEDMLKRTEEQEKDYIENDAPPTLATAKAYHEYLRTDNVWVDDANVIAFNGVKGTGYPRTNSSNEKYYVHKSVSEDEISAGLYLKLTLSDTRKLSGIVFEDLVKDTTTTLGNGTLDDGENNRAKDVTVELLDENRKNATLYQVDDNNDAKKIEQAKLTTTEKGEYIFDGVVPGYYYIRFTYGDGSQKMIDLNGKEIDNIKYNDYRSTIITNVNIKNAMEAGSMAMNLAEWYKTTGNTNYSTAVDDLDQRKAIDGYIYKDDGKVYDNSGNEKTEELNKMTINSYTPMIGISIENDTSNQTEAGTEHKNEFKGFNFGLVRQPDTNMTIEKKITNVKFTNQVGSTLVSENPASKESTYVTALDKITNGSKYAKLEIEPEQIYGSNIEITYEITVENNSVVDYTGDSYYKYGESGETKKKVTVHEVNDDLDEKYNYNSLPKTTTQTTSNESKESKIITLAPVTEKITNSDGTTTESKYIKITGWEALASQESTTTSYTVTALIANNEEDPTYTNDAKIKSLSLDTLSTLNTESASEKHWEADRTVFTVTPTTGENRSETYFVIGAIALAIISAGLILIKKKVL